jgi:hypothetical protein
MTNPPPSAARAVPAGEGDRPCPIRGARVGVVQHRGPATRERAIELPRLLVAGAARHLVLAHVRVRPRESLAVEARLPRSLQPDEE